MTVLVGLVIVSHSAQLAEGVVELAAQMAPDVPIIAAGGGPDGGLGTNYDAVSSAVTEADQGAGVVLLFDLGSARMTAEMVVETLNDPSRAAVAEAPLVEGAVAAAVASTGGADLSAVLAAAEGRPATTPEEQPEAQTTVVLTNESGLHARPAAMLARVISELDAKVTIRRGDHKADATSILAVMALAADKGDELTITATGTQAAEAISRILNLAANNFHGHSTTPPS